MYVPTYALLHLSICLCNYAGNLREWESSDQRAMDSDAHI